jgi:hypothetical protein
VPSVLSEADIQRLEAIEDPRARFLAAHTTLSPYLTARVGARRDPKYQRLRRIRSLALLEHVDRAAEVDARVNLTALAEVADPPVTRQALHYLLAEARRSRRRSHGRSEQLPERPHHR